MKGFEGVPTQPQEEQEEWSDKKQLSGEIARVASDANGEIYKDTKVIERLLGYDEGTDVDFEDTYLAHESLVEHFQKIAERAQRAAADLEPMRGRVAEQMGKLKEGEGKPYLGPSTYEQVQKIKEGEN